MTLLSPGGNAPGGIPPGVCPPCGPFTPEEALDMDGGMMSEFSDALRLDGIELFMLLLPCAS